MKIYRRLEHEDPLNNYIELEIGNSNDTFIITLTKKEIDIECDIDRGYTRGNATMDMKLEDLECLIEELKES